jgi:hypothetical protein
MDRGKSLASVSKKISHLGIEVVAYDAIPVL